MKELLQQDHQRIESEKERATQEIEKRNEEEGKEKKTRTKREHAHIDDEKKKKIWKFSASLRDMVNRVRNQRLVSSQGVNYQEIQTNNDS